MEIRKIKNFFQMILRGLFFNSIWINTVVWRWNCKKELDEYEKHVQQEKEELTQEWAFRLNPNSELQNDLKELLNIEQNYYRILDVGSAGLTQIGKRWNGKTIEIHCVDALAREYNKIHNNKSYIIYGYAETLSRKFKKDSFDLVYCRNALDHCIHPSIAIQQMIEVLKPGCSLYLKHKINEGQRTGYNGLHLHNMNERNYNKLGIADIRYEDDFIIGVLRK